MTRFVRLGFLVVVLALVGAPVPRATAAPSDLQVQVDRTGDEIHVEASMFVRAPRQRVWDVLTDYEHAPDYLRDLEVSKVLSRSGDTLRVFQRDHVHFGPFSFPVETVKEVKLNEPVSAVSRLVRGSLKDYEAKTELVSEPGGTRLVYRSKAIPNSSLARLAGDSFIKRQTEEYFTALRGEILRQEQVANR